MLVMTATSYPDHSTVRDCIHVVGNHGLKFDSGATPLGVERLNSDVGGRPPARAIFPAPR